jgi:regulator of protease activity HflC (stomatin/prohibitin superfamily)
LKVTREGQYGGTYPNAKGWTLIVVAVFVAIIGLVCLFSVYRTVSAGEVGIITRYGDVNRTVDSGAAWKLPWEHIQRMNVQTQREDANANAATKPNEQGSFQVVDAKVTLNYHLERDKALQVFKNIGTDYDTVIIDPALQETFKAVTAQFTAAELISKRETVKNVATSNLQARLSDQGIQVEAVSLTNFSFGKEFEAALERRATAEQDAQTAQAKVAQARAESEAQKLLNTTLSRQILAQQFLTKWDGHLPETWTGGNLPFVGTIGVK